MKIKLLIFSLLFTVLSWSQSIFTNPLTFGSAVQASPYTGGQIVDANLTVSGISRGSDIAGTAASNRYTATGWNSGSLNANDYFEFTLTPNAGYEIDFASFVYTGQASGTGPTSFVFRSSLDGFASNIGAPNVGGTTISLAAGSYQNISTAITFRFYGWGASAAGGTFSINDFTFNGSVILASPVPEINIQGNAANIADGDVTPSALDFTDFGNVNIASSFNRNFAVQNSGTANLNVTAAAISGANASEFVITVSPVGTIGASASAALTIQFTPTRSGTRSATVTITSNDSNEGVYTFDIQGNGVCVPVVIASVYPASGPVGTEVTINASSGSLLGSTVAFNGTAATIVSGTASQLVVQVPSGATTGAINITNTSSTCVTSTPVFTVIKNDDTSCQGSFPTTTDLIIYEVHDEFSGSGGTITFYNGTASTINLSNYRLYRRATYGSGGAAINYANLTGSIASGSLGIIQVTGGANSCTTPAATNGTVNGGYNDDDEISLRNSAGTVVIDEVHASAAGPGYYMVRNIGAYSPRAIFVAADWSTTSLASGDCDPRLGTGPVSTGTTPLVTAQPSLSLTCSSTSVSISVTATEGFAGGNALAYQWYAVAPNTTSWTALTNAGVYTGVTSATLNISSLAGLEGYQYYCQVRENGATCYQATIAVKISGGISTTWNGTAWSNGTPALGKTAIINGTYNTTTHGDIDACSLIVNATFTVTVTANHYINIQNDLTVNGVLDIQDNGSLVQVNDSGVNTGNIFMKRIATVKLLDYVFWSSPVNNFAVTGISPATPSSVIWKWNPSVANPNNGFGNWQNANENMSIGKGYIVRAPNGFNNTTAQDFTANFVGVANNGIQDVAIERGNFTGADYSGTNGTLITKNEDNWNLIGNPYPSAIDAKDFLALNANIEGSVRLWTHGTLPNTTAANPFYGSYAYNYSATDYIVYNATGSSTQGGFDGYIGAGQSFFVLMNDGPAASETVRFQNSLRSKTHRNDQFFRNSNPQNAANDIERHRIWIDLVSSAGMVNRTLIGYVEGATQGKDRLYDAYSDHKSAQDFYSVVNNESMVIQGRALPFADSDFVPMGFKAPANGTYTIAIASVDGLFSGNAQTIYLEDKLLNTIHNLSVAPYQFMTNKGIVDNRFVVRYTNQALGNDDFDLANNNLKIYPSNNEIKIDSSIETIQSYTVYDVLGRVLAEKNNVNANQSGINSIVQTNQALIVKVVLENGQTIIRKIIF